MSPSSIKNVAVAGAAGDVGRIVFRKLAESAKLCVRVLRNHGSMSTYPPGTDVVDVDYSSVEALTAALAGQDALVSAVGATGIDGQKSLIDAAIAAGVSRFIPSDFGANLDHPKVQQLPLFVPKVKIHHYLIEKSKTTAISYTFVYTGSLLDWGFENSMSFDLLSSKPRLIEGGDLPFSGILISTAGDAVLGVLTHPNETRNRSVFVEDFATTQNQLLAMARLAAPEKKWEPVYPKLDDLEAVANVRLSQGLFDMETYRPYIYRALLDPEYGGRFAKLDNELLGVKKRTEKDLLESMKKILK